MVNFKRIMSFMLALVLIIGMIPPIAADASAEEETAAAETTEAAVLETEELLPPAEETVLSEPVSQEADVPETSVSATEDVTEWTDSSEAVTEPSEMPTLPEETTEVSEAPSEPETEPEVELFPEDSSTDSTEENAVSEETQDAAQIEARYAYEGTCGKNLKWYLDGRYAGRYDLHIYGTGPMDNYDMYSDIYAPWDALSIDRIFIESGVTSIGDLAFWGLDVKSVSIPDTVTSIGTRAFFDCDKLEKITLPSKVAEIKDFAFSDCTSLKSIVWPSSLKTIGDYAFSWCDSLLLVSIPEGVTTMGYGAFADCNHLLAATIPASVTNIASTPFADCSSLKTILVDKNNKHYTAVDGILYDIKMTKLISCPGGRTADVIVPEGVKIITSESMAGCSRVKKVVFPKSITKFEMFALRDMKLDAMVFKGDAPDFLETSFPLCSGKVYYPYGNPTWTEDLWSDLVATDLTDWKPRFIYEDGSYAEVYPYLGDNQTPHEDLAIRMAEYSHLAYHDTGNDGKKYEYNPDALGKKMDADGYDDLHSYYYDYDSSQDGKYVENHCNGESSETSILFTIGHRKVKDAKNNPVDEIIMVFRGTYKMEWLGNFDVTGPVYELHGNSWPLHENFDWATESAQKHLADYIDKFADEGKISRENLTVVLTGHSRGAAVANILAHKLNRYKGKLIPDGYLAGNKISTIYAYTFATPNVFYSANLHMPTYEEEKNIYNYCFTDDFVPNLPLEYWGWGKYGKTYWETAEYMSSSDAAFMGVKNWLGKSPTYNAKYTEEIVIALMEAYRDSAYGTPLQHYYTEEYYMAWPLTLATIHDYVRNGLGAQQAGMAEGAAYLASPLTALTTGPFKALATNLAVGGLLNPALKHTHSSISYYQAIKHNFGGFSYSELTNEGYSATHYTLSSVNVDVSDCDPAQVAAINDFLMQKITHEETGAELYNHELLGWKVDDVTDWLGVTWSGGNVVALDMEYKGSVGDLDLSQFPKLEKANLNSCNLSSIDLSGCENLAELYCSSNWLTELDLADCVNLKKLECANNTLETLDLSGCTKLEKLDCSNNNLRQLDLAGLEHLTQLDCGRNYLDSEDALLQEKVQAIRAAGGKVNIADQRVSPDAVFAQNDLNHLLAIAEYENNNEILKWDLEDPASWRHVTWIKSGTSFYLETVDFTDLGLKGAANFEDCLHLTGLLISHNSFTDLSVEGCEALETLWCDWNYLDTANLALPAVENLKVEPQLVGYSLNAEDVSALNALSKANDLYWDSRLYGSNAALTWTAGENGVYALTGLNFADVHITGTVDLRAFRNLQWISAAGAGMSRLVLPESVTALPESAFAGCFALEYVTFTGNPPAISETAFEELSLRCNYPYGADSWSAVDFADYGGSILWEYDPDTVPPLTTSIVIQNASGEDVTGTEVWFDANTAETITFTAVRTPDDAMPITSWKFNPNQAETVFCENGTITLRPKAESGTIELVAETADASGLSAKVSIRFAALRVTKENETEGTDIRLLSQTSKMLQLFDDTTGKVLTNKQVTWSMDEAYAPYAKIDSMGKLIAKKVLERVQVEATASIVGSESTKVTAKIDIFPAATALDLVADNKTVNKQALNVDFTDEPLVLTANIYPLDAMEGVDWVISDKKGAFADYTINGNELTVEPKSDAKPGTVTVKATSTDGSKKSATVKLQFGSFAQTVTIDKSITTLTAGDKPVQLTATVTPDVVTKSGIVWSLKNAADKNYVTLSAAGKITPKAVLAPVDVTVVASSKDGMAFDEHTIRIEPKSAAQLVLKSGDAYITKTTQILDVNTQESITISAHTYGEEGQTTVDWTPKSHKNANITVNADGSLTVQMIAAGSINITAKTEDKRSATVTVKGVKQAQGVEVSQKKTGKTSGLEVASGKSIELQATLVNAGDKKVTWSIESGAQFATVSTSGKVTANKDLTSGGKVVVKATAADGSGATDTIDIMVRPIAQGVQVYSEAGGRMLFSFRTQNWWVRSNTTLNWDLSEQADRIAMAANVYPYYDEDDAKNAMQAVIWKSSAPKVAEFAEDTDGNVSLKIHKTGSATITVTAADGSNQKVTFKLNVIKTVTKLTIGNQSVQSGKSINLNKVITINPTDATNKKLTWTITSGSEYATVSNGTFKAKKVTAVQTVEVTVSSQDGGASTTFTVTITP